MTFTVIAEIKTFVNEKRNCKICSNLQGIQDHLMNALHRHSIKPVAGLGNPLGVLAERSD